MAPLVVLIIFLLTTPSLQNQLAAPDERCGLWAGAGECDANPKYMRQHCVAACDAHDEVQRDIALPSPILPSDPHEGVGLGVDGNPFHLNAVLSRSEGAETCSSSGAPPPIVKLPEEYPAVLTLAPPLNGDGPVRDLDDLHAEGRLEFAEHIYDQGRRTSSTGVAVKIINFTRRRFDEMWDDGSEEGVYNGSIKGQLGARDVLMTYGGHAFRFVDHKTKELYRRIEMRSDVHFIIFPPDKDDKKALASKEYAAALHEAAFMQDYYAHHNYPWLARYGRPAPVLNMWPADHIGQTHVIKTQQSHWNCADFEDPACRPGTDPLVLNLTVASHAPHGPRVFVIENLMSDAECDHVRSEGEKVVGDSIVGDSGGGFKSSSRTSSTGWLSRRRSPILETMSRRFADVLGIDEARLTTQELAEDLQVVRYEHTQRYNPHHDFRDGSGGGYGQRFLTLLLYVEVPEGGGHTAFPKAFDGRGMKVKPPRGSAVLFYSMLPDGNGDDLSLHGGDPVSSGEKWVCNLWVWDPNRYS